MKILNTKFKDLKIIQGERFLDPRGYFREVNKKKLLKKENLIFWCMSRSKKNILRGLHFQEKNAQGKYISVIKGKIFDVAVDLRPKSTTFKKTFTIILSDKNCKSLFLPSGFAHGFYTMEKENLVFYGNTNYRHAKSENGIRWNDKDLNIKWPNKNPIVSKKDSSNLNLKDYLKLKNLK